MDISPSLPSWTRRRRPPAPCREEAASKRNVTRCTRHRVSDPRFRTQVGTSMEQERRSIHRPSLQRRGVDACELVEASHRCVCAKREDEPGDEADEDAGEHPSEGRLCHHRFVEAAGALEQRDTDGGAHLAMGGREGKAVVRAEDDDGGRAHLDAETARRRDDGELDPDGAEDLGAVKAEAEADADAAQPANPELVVAHVLLAPEHAAVV